MKYLIIVAAVLLSAQVAVADLKKDAFAYGYLIEVTGSGSVYSVTLPKDVYAGSVKNGLADIAVFNNDGELVPHEIRVTAKQQSESESDIPFFPLFSEEKVVDNALSLVVTQNNRGSIVNIQSGNQDSVKMDRVVYLFDMGKVEVYPLKLKFKWQGGKDFMVPVRLESSDDLVSWRKIASGTLADLEFMGNRLQHNEIVINRKNGRYLRLISSGPNKSVEISSVSAISGSSADHQKREWLSFPLIRSNESGVSYLTTEIKADFPIDQLQLEFAQPNSILHVHLQSRANSSVKWNYAGSAFFYSLVEESIELHNEPVKAEYIRGRQFRLKVVQDGAGLENKLPELKLGYIPHELIFIARGEGPFVMAFGNSNMEEANSQSGGGMLQTINDGVGKSLVRAAIIKEKQVLGGKAALVVESRLAWRKILLWAVLVAGVVILAAMVWSLRKKMADPGM